MKRLIQIILIMGLLFYMLFVFGFSLNNAKSGVVKGIDTELSNAEVEFISEAHIKAQLQSDKDTLLGKPFAMLNKNELEEKIKGNRYIEDAQIYQTLTGKYKVKVKQRDPILRVWTPTESYYLDAQGAEIPSHKDHVANVHVALGQVSREFAKNELLAFEKKIQERPLWNALLDQIYVDEKEELTLVIRMGGVKVRFGRVENAEKKLRNLTLFLDEVGKYQDLSKYKELDVRFENQIVCTRKNS